MGKKKGGQPVQTEFALFTPKPLDGNTGFFTGISAEANEIKTTAVRTADKCKVYLAKILKIGLDVFGLME
ncbi:MAG: hypothetical protein KJ732_08255 [Candidatus Margulisbacteria bacterium]|nr:hypothetical protein [Candidatus Margulisiibacteriota bacterium]